MVRQLFCRGLCQISQRLDTLQYSYIHWNVYSIEFELWWGNRSWKGTLTRFLLLTNHFSHIGTFFSLYPEKYFVHIKWNPGQVSAPYKPLCSPSQIARSTGPPWGPPGADRAPCGPHVPCYQGWDMFWHYTRRWSVDSVGCCFLRRRYFGLHSSKGALIARFMGPTWGPSGGDRAQVGPMLAPMNFAIWVFLELIKLSRMISINMGVIMGYVGLLIVS